MQVIDRIIELRKQIFQIQYEHWTKDTLFSLRWWVMLLAVIILWFMWWKLLDKKRFNEIGLAGFITAVLDFLLNTLGVEMTLWAYPYQIFGLVRTWSLFELSFITVSFMLLIQYFKEWKKYLIAITIFGAFGSFIVQPLLIYFKEFRLISWKNLYSFPVYIFIGVVVKFITYKIIDIQKRSIKNS